MSYTYTIQHQEQDLFGGDIKTLLGHRFETDNLIRLAEQIDREAYYDIMGEAYNTLGRSSLPVRQMLALEILKQIRKGISDEELIKAFASDMRVMRFCGYTNIAVAQQHVPRSSSSMTHFRNRIVQCEGMEDMIQEAHLKEVIKKVPKKRRKQYDQDSTIIEESIHRPNDVDLLAKFIERSGELLDQCRGKLGNKLVGFIARGRRQAQKIKLEYHFGGKKKEILNEVKGGLIEIGDDMIDLLTMLQDQVEGCMETGSVGLSCLLCKLNALSETGAELLTQQKEMLDKGTKSVANRIVSIHKPQVRPIVKNNRETKFGGKLQMGMIGRTLSVVVGFTWNNVHDSRTVQQGVERYERVMGKPPGDFGGDKGYRDKEAGVYEYLEKKGIANHIQGTQDRKKIERDKRKRLYRRRAFTEPLINNIKTHRGCNKNKYGQETTKQRLIFAAMASNYTRVYA